MSYKFIENPLLDHDQFFLSMKNFLFITFQLLSDEALGIHQCLFTNPIGWNFVFVGVAYFEVVAKDSVVRNFQRVDPGSLYFTLLNLKQIVFSGEGDLLQFIQFIVNSFFDDAALITGY